MSHNPMSVDDYEAISWLEEESLNSLELANAWKILKSYYEECKEELRNIDKSNSPFESVQEKDKVYGLVLDTLSNESFMDECCEYLSLTKEEIIKILQQKKATVYQEWIVVQIARLYNMHLKLGHSARITYIADKELEKIPNVENKDVLKRTVLLSALLHDVGRFYQAAHYNDLADSRMKKKEDKINGLDVDHAIAGYYYSLASALELHKLGEYKDQDELLRYISEVVAAVVVKCHQKSNSSISYFDYDGDSHVLENSELLSTLYNYTNRAYDQAKLLDFSMARKMNDKHKEFIDQFVLKIKNIIVHRDMDYSLAAGFEVDYEHVDQLYVDIDHEIHDVLEHTQGKSTDDVSSSIVEIMGRKIHEITNIELNEQEKSKYQAEIVESLKEMLDYDIAESIETMFQEGQDIPDEVRFLLSSSMSMTMDADKIDILNQRALGIYNTSYKIRTLEVFPTSNDNLVRILNRYFHFDLDSEEIQIDSNIMSVFQRMNPEVMKTIHEYLGDMDIFDFSKYPEKSNINITKDEVVINGVPYSDDRLYKLFHDNWIDFLSKNMNLEPLNYKDFKKKYLRTLQLSIPTSVFDRNIDCFSENAKVDAYRKLLVTNGLKERFMLEGENGIQAGWINAVESEDTDHLVNSSVSGLLWQLNQFIMVNMRDKHSYEFIEENHILDQILEQYQKKSPIIADIIGEYLDYCKGFIHYTLEHVQGDMLTGEILKKMRHDYYEERMNLEKEAGYQAS